MRAGPAAAAARAPRARADCATATSTCCGRDLEQPGLVGSLMQAGPVSADLRALVAAGAGPGRQGRRRPRHGGREADRAAPDGARPGRRSARRRLRARQLLPRLRARGRRRWAWWSGVDASRPMLERAVRETSAAGIDNLCFVFADAAALPFRDASFDAACCFAALNLFAEPFRALDEMRRVLAPGRAHRPVHEQPRPHRARCGRSRARSRRRRASACSTRKRSWTRCASAASRDIRQRLSGLTQFVGGRLPA